MHLDAHRAFARIGFMQGRLSPRVDGKIQAFPWDHWRAEFEQAKRLGFALMEWTLDADRLAENPFMTPAGQAQIRALAESCWLTVPSVTGDCFMQTPFFKAGRGERRERLEALHTVIASCAALNVRYLVFPLVDAGSLQTPEQERDVLQTLAALDFERSGLCIVFESDYSPERLARFIDAFPAQRFGINYDIGNSASLGFDPEQELAAYGARIRNVHVKDRMLGGTTVPLGTGDADFRKIFAGLARLAYRGNYILQTARAADDDHAGVLCRYRDMVCGWLDQFHGS